MTEEKPSWPVGHWIFWLIALLWCARPAVGPAFVKMFVPESSYYRPVGQPARYVAGVMGAMGSAPGAPPLAAAVSVAVDSRIELMDSRPRRLWAMHDFFQEWASARNYLEGQPIYAHQERAVVRYLGWPIVRNHEGLFIEYSSRPPTYVLFVLPFGYLDYPTAALVWNLLSLIAFGVCLYAVVRHLDIPLALRHLIPLVVLSLLASPLRQQVFTINVNLLLLPLLIGVWRSDSTSRPVLAGVLLGLAIVVKIFPGLLLVYFLVLRKYRTVVATLATVCAVFALSLMVFGIESYRDYVQLSMPFLAPHRSSWDNISLIGFWTRLLDAQEVFGSVSISLVESPLLARSLIVLSALVLLLFLVKQTWNSKAETDSDQLFSLFFVSMLLLSPVAWDHYLLLTIPAIALVWQRAHAREHPEFWIPLTLTLMLAPVVVAVSHNPFFLLLFILPWEVLGGSGVRRSFFLWVFRLTLTVFGFRTRVLVRWSFLEIIEKEVTPQFVTTAGGSLLFWSLQTYGLLLLSLFVWKSRPPRARPV